MFPIAPPGSFTAGKFKCSVCGMMHPIGRSCPARDEHLQQSVDAEEARHDRMWEAHKKLEQDILAAIRHTEAMERLERSLQEYRGYRQ